MRDLELSLIYANPTCSWLLGWAIAASLCCEYVISRLIYTRPLHSGTCITELARKLVMYTWLLTCNRVRHRQGELDTTRIERLKTSPRATPWRKQSPVVATTFDPGRGTIMFSLAHHTPQLDWGVWLARLHNVMVLVDLTACSMSFEKLESESVF